ncbi:MAG TPA: hypothetical protein VFZ78_10040 [Flavisolibacter sp.]
MRHLFAFLLLPALLWYSPSFSQAQKPEAEKSETEKSSKINKVAFFTEEAPLDVTLTLDMKRFMNKKINDGFTVPALFSCKLADGTEVNEQIYLEVRGKYRRENCYLPPLKLRFKNESSPTLAPLGALKLVNPCDNQKIDNDFLLKEYIVYKLYNTLTDKSLRVRLLNIKYIDSSGKRKPIVQNSFLIEDVDDMAKRNNCRERERRVVHTDATDRAQMTLVAIFEYMIGNTDWSVPGAHNIKLIAPKEDTTTTPYPVAYDFDHAGMVNTSYALPNEQLPIATVRQRLYRGFPRTMEELEESLQIFRAKKDEMYSIVNNFAPMSNSARKDIISYLDEFYRTINNPGEVRQEFIQNARKD